jgi:creatinine amidohydrolase
MTWPEVAEALEAGRTTAVVAVGAVEQHGPHLPLLVDAARGDRLALEGARRLGDSVVGPTIRVGCSEHHMGFPGTISVRRATLEAVCLDYCVSLARHGFRRVYLIPSHGGNFGPLKDMLDDLNRVVAPACEVRAYTDLDGFLALWATAVDEVAGLGHRVGGHADIAESSEMLVIRPDLVQASSAVAGYTEGTDGGLLERIFRDGLRSVTPNGVLGDARGLSAEIGERCLAVVADAVAEVLRANS